VVFFGKEKEKEITQKKLFIGLAVDTTKDDRFISGARRRLASASQRSS